MKAYIKTILIFSMFVAFMIASTGFFAVYPRLAQVTKPLTCSDGTFVLPERISRRTKFYCVTNNQKREINPFKLLGVGMLVYSLLLFPVIWLFYRLYLGIQRKR